MDGECFVYFSIVSFLMLVKFEWKCMWKMEMHVENGNTVRCHTKRDSPIVLKTRLFLIGDSSLLAQD